MTIDWWTLGIQAVNVIILVWLLARFFWRPVAAMIEQRRATAQQILTEAESKRSQAAARLAEIAQTRAGFNEEREKIIAAAHEAAEQARALMLAAATKEAEALRAAAGAAIEQDRKAAEAAWIEHANRLAVDIARRLVTRLDGPEVNAAFLSWLLQEIRKLPESVRNAAAADGVMLEAVSAGPLDPTEQDRCRMKIGEAFGGRPHITFQVDAALIAGLELRGPNLLVANSWRADLARILTDLAHDQGS